MDNNTILLIAGAGLIGWFLYNNSAAKTVEVSEDFTLKPGGSNKKLLAVSSFPAVVDDNSGPPSPLQQQTANDAPDITEIGLGTASSELTVAEPIILPRGKLKTK
jgi:hypothetical protein